MEQENLKGIKKLKGNTGCIKLVEKIGLRRKINCVFSFVLDICLILW